MNVAEIKTILDSPREIQILDKLDIASLNKEKDTFSRVFEIVVNIDQRKKYAQFFTHKELVNFILSNIPINEDTKILDPACGAGAFLIKAYEKNKNNLDNLHGIDIDNAALKLCEMNFKQISNNNAINLRKANTLKSSSLDTLFPEIAARGGFDVIVGNPPFQNLNKYSDYNGNESIYNQIISGVTNSATLMVGKGYEFLKDNGYLGYVLPKNVARVESFRALRSFLINNTKLLCIYDLDHYFKDVRCDQIILIFQKKKLSLKEMRNHNVKVMIYKKSNDFTKPYTYEIPQSEFLKHDYFPIYYNKNISDVVDKLIKIQTTLETVTNGEIFRGIGLSAKSGIISKKPGEHSIEILRGDSICRFGIKYPLYIDKEYLAYLPKNKTAKLQTRKIVLQNICSKEGGIFATISDSKQLALDTVTNIVPNNIAPEYLLGILSSKIANFFILMVIFLNSNFTMHTDKKYIGQLPVVIPDIKRQQEVINIVNKLVNIKDKYSPEFFRQYNILNYKLYNIYALSKSESQIIDTSLKEVMSKKQHGE